MLLSLTLLNREEIENAACRHSRKRCISRQFDKLCQRTICIAACKSYHSTVSYHVLLTNTAEFLYMLSCVH